MGATAEGHRGVAGAVPDPSKGVDYVGKPERWRLETWEKFTAEDYHKPSDKLKPYWDLRGAVEDLQLLGAVGYRVANAKVYLTWKANSEFKTTRETMPNLAKRGTK
jgi:hypothetical protein